MTEPTPIQRAAQLRNRRFTVAYLSHGKLCRAVDLTADLVLKNLVEIRDAMGFSDRDRFDRALVVRTEGMRVGGDFMVSGLAVVVRAK